MKFVSIIMGSKSDYDVVSEAAKVLEKFNVPYELIISSAHRSPKRTSEYVAAAEEKGAQVFIAAAGMAAHLAGAIAANTTRPVIGIPMAGSALSGVDALYSTVQMPGGMPVQTPNRRRTGLEVLGTGRQHRLKCQRHVECACDSWCHRAPWQALRHRRSDNHQH